MEVSIQYLSFRFNSKVVESNIHGWGPLLGNNIDFIWTTATIVDTSWASIDIWLSHLDASNKRSRCLSDPTSACLCTTRLELASWTSHILSQGSKFSSISSPSSWEISRCHSLSCYPSILLTLRRQVICARCSLITHWDIFIWSCDVIWHWVTLVNLFSICNSRVINIDIWKVWSFVPCNSGFLVIHFVLILSLFILTVFSTSIVLIL